MIGIIDYGMGNLLSVHHAFEYLGADVKICNDPAEIESVDRIVLPGVGAFRDGMANLQTRGFVEVLNERIIGQRRPFLGVCLGMQATARQSFEGGCYQGLGWIDADVVRLEPDPPTLRGPHVGWNAVSYRPHDGLFAKLPDQPEFYFVHSYALRCDRDELVAATFDYGGRFTASVRQDNLFAVQFHPEKSQTYGLQLLTNFLNWNP